MIILSSVSWSQHNEQLTDANQHDVSPVKKLLNSVQRRRAENVLCWQRKWKSIMLTAAKDALAAPRPHGAFHLSGKGERTYWNSRFWEIWFCQRGKYVLVILRFSIKKLKYKCKLMPAMKNWMGPSIFLVKATRLFRSAALEIFLDFVDAEKGEHIMLVY